VEVDETGNPLPQNEQPIIYAEKQKQRKEAIKDMQDDMLAKRQEGSTGAEPAAQIEEPQINPTPLGRLEEYSEDVNTVKEQKLEQDEILANDIDAESNILLEEITSLENLALLPKEARDSLDEIGALETKVEKYETVVEAGRACVVRGKSG